MTEFSDLGAHCSVARCNHQDFLPIECRLCKKFFCRFHAPYDAHECPFAAAEDRRVIICPICQTSIAVVPGEDVNDTWLRHANAGDCSPSRRASSTISHDGPQHKNKVVGGAGGKKRLPTCPVKGCKTKLTSINSFQCEKCNTKVCMAHRFEEDHDCAGLRAAAERTSGFRIFGGRRRSSQNGGDEKFSSKNTNNNSARTASSTTSTSYGSGVLGGASATAGADGPVRTRGAATGTAPKTGEQSGPTLDDVYTADWASLNDNRNAENQRNSTGKPSQPGVNNTNPNNYFDPSQQSSATGVIGPSGKSSMSNDQKKNKPPESKAYKTNANPLGSLTSKKLDYIPCPQCSLHNSLSAHYCDACGKQLRGNTGSCTLM